MPYFERLGDFNFGLILQESHPGFIDQKGLNKHEKMQSHFVNSPKMETFEHCQKTWNECKSHKDPEKHLGWMKQSLEISLKVAGQIFPWKATVNLLVQKRIETGKGFHEFFQIFTLHFYFGFSGVFYLHPHDQIV